MGVDKILASKVALVTGASRGIGRAGALILGAAGAQIIINYQGNTQAAQETLSLLQEAGGAGEIMQADVASAGQVDDMVKYIMERFGRLDILINNAGITRDGLMLRMKDEDWEQVISTNLTGAFYCTRAAARPMMKQRSGRIVNISSVVGLSGNAGQVNYASAKAGIIGLTKASAKELSSRGITVNAIAPGFIQTDMTDRLSDEVKAELSSRIPLGRLGSPADIANLVLFLAGPYSEYITGQVIAVDGGMTM